MKLKNAYTHQTQPTVLLQEACFNINLFRLGSESRYIECGVLTAMTIKSFAINSCTIRYFAVSDEPITFFFLFEDVSKTQVTSSASIED
jgi:hypothetical protein